MKVYNRKEIIAFANANNYKICRDAGRIKITRCVDCHKKADKRYYYRCADCHFTHATSKFAGGNIWGK